MGPEILRVTLKINDACQRAKYLVTVTFGTRPLAGSTSADSCAGVKNVTKDPLSPGETASFSLDSGSISLRPGEDYCYFVSFNQVSSVTSLQPVILTNCGFSVGGVAGVAVGLTLVVAVPVGAVLGCLGMWCLVRRRGGKKKDPPRSSSDKEELTDDVYEEPDVPAGDQKETMFSLSANQAYAQALALNRQRNS